MAVYSELEELPLEKLIDLFEADVSGTKYEDEEYLWYQEIAVRIGQNGNSGLTYLIQAIPNANALRLRAILLSFSFVDKSVLTPRFNEVKTILQSFLANPNPMVVAEAVDSLGGFGVSETLGDVQDLLHHTSPYVIGSVLRYLSRHHPGIAKPILLEALESPQPIVRQNAIDELDGLGYVKAVPNIRSLFSDSDADVRQAALTAVQNLESIGDTVSSPQEKSAT